MLVKTGLKEYFGWTIVPSVSMYPGHVLTSFFAHEDYMHQAAMASQDFYCCWLLEGESTHVDLGAMLSASPQAFLLPYRWGSHFRVSFPFGQAIRASGSVCLHVLAVLI